MCDLGVSMLVVSDQGGFNLGRGLLLIIVRTMAKEARRIEQSASESSVCKERKNPTAPFAGRRIKV